MEAPRLRAAVYVRISDDKVGEAAGVARQEADTRALCQRRGWDVVEVFEDNDFSASRYARRVRPAYRRMLAQAEAGEIDVIACWDVDRAYRQPKELEELIDLAERMIIASVQGDLRLDTPDGRAMARVLAAMAAKESDDKSRRLRRKHQELAEAGQVSGGGRRPFGYEADRVTVRPDEAELVREAALRIVGGDSLHGICADWNARGVRPVAAARWDGTAMRRFLESPRIAGLRAHRGVVVGPAVWEPILDMDLWNRVRAELAAPRGTGVGPVFRTYLLTGLAMCARCDLAMTGGSVTRKGHKYPRYACFRSRGGCSACGIAAGPLEELVGASYVANRLPEVAPSQPLRLVAGMDLSDVVSRADAEVAELAALLGSGVMSPAAYAAATNAIAARVETERRKASTARVSRDVQALATAKDPAAAWEAVPRDRKRSILREAINRIDIQPGSKARNFFDQDRIDIRWRD